MVLTVCFCPDFICLFLFQINVNSSFLNGLKAPHESIVKTLEYLEKNKPYVTNDFFEYAMPLTGGIEPKTQIFV